MPADDQLVVVVVEESISAALAGHEGGSYVSPPQPREQALALVAMPLGCPAAVEPERGDWTQPIAGGQRTIALRPAPGTSR
jgi:hypothetical protein